jgi:hypothetical protein
MNNIYEQPELTVITFATESIMADSQPGGIEEGETDFF